MTLADRIFRGMTERDGCWLWPRLDRGGYPKIEVNGKTRAGHRVAHETFNGPIPSGYEVDHLCFRPACVNPNHLEAVTPEENRRRAMEAGRFLSPRQRGITCNDAPARNAAKTHCRRGHALSGDNVRITRWRGKTMRSCVTCKTLHNARRYVQVETSMVDTLQDRVSQLSSRRKRLV